jgi:hypothetical protein
MRKANCEAALQPIAPLLLSPRALSVVTICVLPNSFVTSLVLPLRRFESHLHQLEERSKIEMHKSSLLQQQVRRVAPA